MITKDAAATVVKKDKLLAQGLKALGDCNPDLAVKFFERAYHLLGGCDLAGDGVGAGNTTSGTGSSPLLAECTDLLDVYADALLQIGRIDDARHMLLQSTALAPAVNVSKWCYLAQLQHSREALHSYTQAVAYLTAAAQTGESVTSPK